MSKPSELEPILDPITPTYEKLEVEDVYKKLRGGNAARVEALQRGEDYQGNDLPPCPECGCPLSVTPFTDPADLELACISSECAFTYEDPPVEWLAVATAPHTRRLWRMQKDTLQEYYKAVNGANNWRLIKEHMQRLLGERGTLIEDNDLLNVAVRGLSTAYKRGKQEEEAAGRKQEAARRIQAGDISEEIQAWIEAHGSESLRWAIQEGFDTLHHFECEYVAWEVGMGFRPYSMVHLPLQSVQSLPNCPALAQTLVYARRLRHQLQARFGKGSVHVRRFTHLDGSEESPVGIGVCFLPPPGVLLLPTVRCVDQPGGSTWLFAITSRQLPDGTWTPAENPC